MKQCSLCDRTSKTHHITEEGICNCCVQYLYYWRQKTAKQIMKRLRQVESFERRLEVLAGSNVKRLRRSA